MATIVNAYVDPGATGAGDGTSWADACPTLVSAVGLFQRNLVAADEELVFNCRCSTAATDIQRILTTAWSNYVTGPNNRVLILNDDGTYENTSGLQGIQISLNYAVLRGIRVSSSSDAFWISETVTGDGLVIAEGCSFKSLGAAAFRNSGSENAGFRAIIRNCVLDGATYIYRSTYLGPNLNRVNFYNNLLIHRHASNTCLLSRADLDAQIRNNVFVFLGGSTSLTTQANTQAVLANNAAYAPGADFSAYVEHDLGVYGPGFAAVYADFAGGDYQLVAGSPVAGVGLNLSDVLNCSHPFADDFNQDARVVPWDLGPIMAAASASVSEGAGSIAAIGSLAGAGSTSKSGTGSVAAQGSLTGAGTTLKSGGGSVAAAGSLAATGQSVRSGAGSVAALGGLVGAGTAPVVGAAEGAGTISAVAALVGAGQSPRSGAGALVASGTLAGAGSTLASGSGQVVSLGQLVGSGSTTREGWGRVVAAATLDAAGLSLRYGYSTITAQGVIDGYGYAAHGGAGAISAAGVLAGAGQAPSVDAAAGAGQILGTATLSGAGVAVHSGAGAVAAVATLVGRSHATYGDALVVIRAINPVVEVVEAIFAATVVTEASASVIQVTEAVLAAAVVTEAVHPVVEVTR